MKRNDLIASAACMRLQRATADDVMRAVEAGLESCHHGTPLPLPLLLDLEVLRHDDFTYGVGRIRPADCDLARHYDATLQSICEQLHQHCNISAYDQAADVAHLNYVFVAAQIWPQLARTAKTHGSLGQWTACYASLLDDADGIESVLSAGRRKRSSRPLDWKHVWSGEPHRISKERDMRGEQTASGMLTVYEWVSPPGTRVQEEFDHSAGHLYLNADDPILLSDQVRRIQQIHETQNTWRIPFKSTPEDVDPRYGDPPPDLLIKEFDYVAMALANGWHDLRNRPPTSSPPRRVEIHLCWTTGYSAGSHRHRHVVHGPATRRKAGTQPEHLRSTRRVKRESTGSPELTDARPANGDETQSATFGADDALRGTDKMKQPADPHEVSTKATGHPTYASTLQGLASLIVDDIRSALCSLPVVVHMHRTESFSGTQRKPELKQREERRGRKALRSVDRLDTGDTLSDASVKIGRPGLRWKETVWSGGELPPADAVRLLFRRRRLSECLTVDAGFHVPESDLPFQPPAFDPSHWFCCVITRHDLEELGFQTVTRAEHRTRGNESAILRCADPEVLPRYMTHVVVIEDADGRGQFYRAVPSRVNSETSLYPLLRQRVYEPCSDSSFIDFRTEMLDVVLGAVESRMK